MAMSSYMVNSKYVDPKFPPCEEYLQNNYLAEQGSDYYGASQDSDFQHQGLYARPNYSGQQPYSCGNAQGSAGQARGHGQEQSGLTGPFPGQGEHCPPPPVPAAPRTCSQHPNLKSPNGSPAAAAAAAAAKQPAVVYPWMKKVHVNSGKPPFLFSISPPPRLSLSLSLFFPFFFFSLSPSSKGLSRFYQEKVRGKSRLPTTLAINVWGLDEIGLLAMCPEAEGDSLSQRVLGFLKSTLWLRKETNE